MTSLALTIPKNDSGDIKTVSSKKLSLQLPAAIYTLRNLFLVAIFYARPESNLRIFWTYHGKDDVTTVTTKYTCYNKPLSNLVCGGCTSRLVSSDVLLDV